MAIKHAALVALFIVVGSALAACSTSEPPLLRPTVESEVSPTSIIATTELSDTSEDSDVLLTDTPKFTNDHELAAIDIMWNIIGAYGSVDENAVKAAARNGHPGLVPVLVEAASRTFEPDLALEISRALEEITGDSVGGDFALVAPWFSWMSRQDPPQTTLAGFDEWKGELLATIDPSFKRFIYKGVSSRIPLWTVDWGGVVRDGIPPLEFPSTVLADEVDFLNADEPVFGVTINGESRAYPHRIMGWHELANDRLGGEQITFVF